MSSHVSRIAQVNAEAKKNPVIRQYLLILKQPSQDKISLISPTEWGFIYDGIINPPLRNILNMKEIYLEYTYSSENCLSMTSDKRAELIAQNTFTDIEEFKKYCSQNNVEVIDTYTVENITLNNIKHSF